MIVLLSIILSCQNTTVENTSGLAWTDEDQKILNSNRGRCAELYEDAPCLKLFKKVNHLTYHAICGAVRDQ